VFVLPFFVIYKVQMRPAMMIGVYVTLSLGAVDIAFSLTRFLKVENTAAGDFRAITTIGTFIPSIVLLASSHWKVEYGRSSSKS
jgi:heme/copper-type cytochrome/quinol oxidase subunit 4